MRWRCDDFIVILAKHMMQTSCLVLVRLGGALVCVLGMFQPIYAQDIVLHGKLGESHARAPSFQQAVEQARLVEPRHRAAAFKLSSQMQDLEIAKARLRPKVSLAVSKSWVNLTRDDGVGIQVNQGYLSNSEVLSVRQPMYAPALNADESQQIALYRSYEQGLFQEQVSLFLRVVDVSLEYLSATQELQLINEQLQLLNQRLAATHQRFSAGQGTRTEISEVNVELERLKAQVPMLQMRVMTAQLDFRVMTGYEIQWANVNWSAIQSNQHLMLPVKDKALSLLRDTHPEILSKRFELESSKWALQSVSARHKPSLDLAGQSGRTLGESAYFTESRTRTQSIGVQLNWSFYEGGGVIAAERQAALNLELAQARLHEAESRVLTDYQKAHSQYLNGSDKVAAFQRTLNAAKETSFANQRSFQTGFRSMIDVMQSEGRALQVSSELMRARLEWLQAWIRASAMLAGDQDGLNQLVDICNSKIFIN